MVRTVPADIAERLQLAAEVFAEHGFDATRVEDLADATGVPRATLYYYFDGKEDILAHVLKVMLARVEAAVAAAAGGEGNAVERLAGVLRAQLQVMAAHPANCRILLAELGRAGRLPDIASSIRAGFHSPVRSLLQEGAEDGSMRTVDPDLAASAIYGATIIPGLHQLVLASGLDAEHVAELVTDLLTNGLTPRRPARRRGGR